MTCYLSCFLAVAIISSSVAIMISTRAKLLTHQFVATLDADQRQTYAAIVQERFRHYSLGAVVGLFLALIYYMATVSYRYDFSMCMFAFIVVMTQYVVYRLMPKSDWMVRHLKNEKQVAAWQDVYHIMTRQSHIGFLVGLVGYGILAWGLGGDGKK